MILITSLPTENAALRQRAWRALKASGSAVLRDGVYLMPQRTDCTTMFEGLAAEILAGGGSALVLPVQEPTDADFAALFDRRDEYTALLTAITETHDGLTTTTAHDTLKQARRLRKQFNALSNIDFFPGESRRQADVTLQGLEQKATRLLSPDEPIDTAGDIPCLRLADYRQRLWATRQRPWVNRLASAWLIRRFIDRKARFLWLDSPADCPADALGFDFDGATFTHVGNRVTFEVLLTSFNLTEPALLRLGQLVHFLDVGGMQPAEAAGVESILAGMRDQIEDDNQLMERACSVFDGLLAAFTKQG